LAKSKGVGYGRKGIARAPSLVGQRFGHLVVTARESAPGEDPNVHWVCQCDCGAVHVARGDRLRRGRSRACHRWCEARWRERWAS
jgi:hypothetical protein